MRRPLLILYPWTFFSLPAEREVKEVVEMANHVRGSSSIEGKNAVDRTDERRRGATGTATAFSPITPTVTKSANTMMSQSGPSDSIARSCLSSLQNNPVRRRRDRQTSRLRRPTPLLGWQILKEQAGKKHLSAVRRNRGRRGGRRARNNVK